MSSQARLFFQKLENLDNTEGYQYLVDISEIDKRDEPFYEDEWIDFKTLPESRSPNHDEKRKEIWSKALSGFANIIDGVIVWGIEAEQRPGQTVDAACGLRLINDPRGLVTRLKELLASATKPPVMNVRYLQFVDEKNQGFVICLIPRSDQRPHRAEFAKKQYWYRAGDNFLEAEPGLLRTLFYPERSCSFEISGFLNYQIDQRGHYASGKPYVTLTKNLELSMTVLGPNSARECFVILRIDPDQALRLENGPDWNIAIYRPGGHATLAAKRVIHPEETIQLIQPSRYEIASDATQTTNGYQIDFYPFTVRLSVYALDQLRRDFILKSVKQGLLTRTSDSIPLISVPPDRTDEA